MMNYKQEREKRVQEYKKVAKIKSLDGPYVNWMKEKQNSSKYIKPDDTFNTSIPTLSFVLNDFSFGITTIVGKPNRGKSTLLVNAACGVLDNNEDTVVVDVSLDDDLKKRRQQYVACLSGLSYQEILAYDILPESKKENLKSADTKIEDWIESGRLRILESSVTELPATIGAREIAVNTNMRSFGNLLASIERVRVEFPNKKIIFFLDSWNNMSPDRSKGTSELSALNECLELIKQTLTDKQMMMVMSAHSRKGDETNGRLTLEDIKGSSDVAFASSTVISLLNSYKDDPYNEPLMWLSKEKGTTIPVVVGEILKNKSSGEERPLFYAIESDRCRLISFTNDDYIEQYEKFQEKVRAQEKRSRR